MKMAALLTAILLLAGKILEIHCGQLAEFKDIWSVEEGFCAGHYPPGNVYKNFLNDLQPDGGFYYPYGSQGYYLTLAQRLLGRAPRIDELHGHFCPRIELQTSPDYSIDFGVQYGFGRREPLVCDKFDILGNHHTCYAQQNKRWQKFAQFYRTLTDQKSFMVLVRCEPNGEKSWIVASTKPRLDKVTSHKIAEHVQALGFNPNKFTTMDYSHCKNTNTVGYGKPLSSYWK